MYYSLHKVSLNRVGSHIDSLDWIKHKKATINPKSKDNECFKDAITAALNHKRVKKDPQRIYDLTLFLINMIGRMETFHHTQNTGKLLNKTTKQLPSVSYLQY